ncbi:proteasome ATPase [Bogoriella caseilytica]|nr:proteasome ATPase [Bogoriella caseilytica]
MEQRALSLAAKNDRLADALDRSRDRLIALQEQLDAATKPPGSFGTFLAGHLREREADILTSGRKMRLSVATSVPLGALRPGQEVRINEQLVVVGAGSYETIGELVTVSELIDEGAQGRVLVHTGRDDDRVIRLAGPLRDGGVRVGDSLLADLRTGFATERIVRSEVEDLLLEETPDVDYSDIGGLGPQIEQIRDSVELPFRHPELYREHGLKPPKGVLLYGPPGCGKTLIAKAVAASLADLGGSTSGRVTFLNIKGPELLNKYVGETERHIRVIFARAREKAADGVPVVVFFDEMESLFRTRGTGVSSDVETTVVPQLLAEIDGVEKLENVIVIGASNREDMIDPAILRPGRLDVKIKIERPDLDGAREIFAKYLTPDLPLHPEEISAHGDAERTVAAMIDTITDALYGTGPDNEFLEVTYASGAKEVLYVKDFASGAMIANIVDRAKKHAIKDLLAGADRGLRTRHLLAALAAETAENEDLPNTTNPDDWARVSGRKGERITYLRTLHSSGGPAEAHTSHGPGHSVPLADGAESITPAPGYL